MDLHLPHHPEAQAVASGVAKLFWTLVISTLMLIGGGLLLAPSQLMTSTTFVVVLVLAVGLWLLHAAGVHRHHDEDAHDPQMHRVRERRGF